MKKHWLFTTLLALAICVICFVLCPTEAKAADISDLTFTLNSDGESYAVSDCKTSASGALEIPATYNGKPVTTIYSEVFWDCNSLTSITIPDSITSMDRDAFFYCSSLTSILVSENNTSYSSDAYGVLFNKGKTELICAPRAISGNYTIPDSVTSIGGYAFGDCTNLTNIAIPDGVTSVGYSVFSGCSSLTSITIPNSVTSIGKYAFDRCISLTSITIPDSVTIIGNYAFYGCSSLIGITIPDSVTSIGDSAFKHCTSLTSVTIGNSVTSIGDSAFCNCSSLTSITISDSVTIIGNYAFYGCSSLKNVYYSGSERKWSQISIGSGNNKLTGATIHYQHVHDYSLVPAMVVPATCTEAGYTEYTCAYGEKHRADYVLALGHIMGTDTVVVAPTCDSQGYTAIQCTRCSEISKTDYVDSLGHSMVYEAEKKATCTEDGHTEGTLCSRCGFLGTATKLEKGHSYDANNKCACGDQKLGVLTQPKTAKVKNGATAKFTVKASGDGLKYQWQSSGDGKTWKNCSSSTAKKATFTFTSKTSHSSNYYRCKVTNSAGKTVYTDAVRLYVLGITSQPKTQKVEAGEKVKFSVTATGASKTYQWQSSADGKTWKNCSSSSATSATFTFTGKTSHSSNYYRCRIKDSGGNTVYTDAVRLYVLGITEQPVSKTVTKGKTAKFTVEATGASKTYQWQVSTDGGKTWKNCSSSSAKKATFTFTSKTTHNGNYYRCRIKDSGGNTVYTSKVKLTVKK